MSYKIYLSKRKLRGSSIESYELGVIDFANWLDQKRLEIAAVSYQTMIEYMGYLRSRGNKSTTINHKLRAVKYYLDYRYIKPNPCNVIKLRSRGKPLPSPLLTELEVNHIYNSYPGVQDHEIRTKVLLGLMCYQALDSGELQDLSVSMVNEEMGVILVKKKAKSASRSLRITEEQKPMISKYIEEVRPRMQEIKPEETRFILHYGKATHLGNVLTTLNQRLRKNHKKFKSFRQLRASVISNWLKHYNLREVQYMAGHRYVSSTEKYLESRVEELQHQLDQLHPMR